MLQIPQRALDKICRSMQCRIDGNALRIKGRPQTGQRLLNGKRGSQRICAILAGQ
ncbi:MAG: hypothetical protein WDM77_18470 [Steroidobacteraceae bacterium]